MIKINEIKDHKKEVKYLDEVSSLSIEAQRYLMSFQWCKKIINGWLAKDWGYMLCIFYFEIEPAKNSEADNFVWIVVGDIPSAYIDIESAKDELEVLKVYTFLMNEWIRNVKQGKSVEDCFPIGVSPTIKHADMLSRRIAIIESDFITQLEKSS
jgi:hypothetical protein